MTEYTRDHRRWRFPALTVCPACLYDLAGLPGEHRCPECGLEYDRSHAFFRVRSGRGSGWSQWQSLIQTAWPAAWLLAWYFHQVSFGAFIVAYIAGLVVIPLSFSTVLWFVRARHGGDARLWILPTEVREQNMFGRYRAHAWSKCRTARMTPARWSPISGTERWWNLRITPAWNPVPTWWGIDVQVKCDRRSAARLRNVIRRAIAQARREPHRSGRAVAGDRAALAGNPLTGNPRTEDGIAGDRSR